MPNWCSNEIIVNPKSMYKDHLEELVMKDGDVDFNIVVPEPEHNTEVEKVESSNSSTLLESILPAWYAWRILNWGTKWNSVGAEVIADSDDDNLYIINTTAWSPPSVWFKALCATLADKEIEGSVTLIYIEPGNGIAGRIEYRDGVTTSVDYDIDSPEYKAIYIDNYGDDS